MNLFPAPSPYFHKHGNLGYEIRLGGAGPAEVLLLIFGHLGPSLIAGRYGAGKERFTWQAAALTGLWAVMPDLIDKPLYKLGFNPVLSSRLWGHSLLASALAVVLVLLFFKRSWPWVLAMPGHLILDAMWERPLTLFWPFLGNTFDTGWSPCPSEIFRQGYLAIYQWRWQLDPWLVLATLGAEFFGFILFLAAVRHLKIHKVEVEPSLWTPLP